MRADIHDGREQNELQREAGYIDARPNPATSTFPLATHGRSIHSGHRTNPLARESSAGETVREVSGSTIYSSD
jgi:hypothetical protein